MIVATNDAFALYDKSGRPIDEISSLGMFASLVRPDGYGWGDPRVLFDRQADRYFLAFSMRKGSGAGPCGCDLRWLMAVSRSNAPRTLRPSDWHLYSLDGTMEHGRPSTTGDGDNLVMATDGQNLVLHAYVAASPGADEQSTKIWVFDKSKLVSGAPVERPDREFLSVRDPLTGRPLLRLLPAMMADDPGRVFLVGRSNDTRSCSLVVGAVTGPALSAELALRHVAVPGTCLSPPHSVQRGGGTPLASLGDVMAQPAYGQGRMWLTHAVADRRNANGARGAARVVELDVSRWPDTPRVLTDARFGATDRWFSYPAVIANDRGDVALTMSGSGFDDYASVWVTGRLAGDAPGTFRPAVRVKGGVANLNQVFRTSQRNGDTMNKFADFGGAALDPIDGSAWLIGSYVANVCSSGTWVTRLDWSIATADSGADPASLATLSGPVCSTATKPFLTLLFDGEVTAQDAPSGTRAIRFTYMNADLADPAVGLRLESPNVGWRVVPPALIVFVPNDLIPGSHHLRVALGDGRATGTSFTLLPPH